MHARDRFPLLPAGLSLLLMGLIPSVGRAQMMEGCRLVGGTLQCVPGLTADPQQQIRVLQQGITDDLEIEGAVRQRIEGLQAMVLDGEAAEGALLTASLQGEGMEGPPPGAFHWYRRGPASQRWVLIETASGPTYAPGSEDVGQSLMVVLTVSEADGVKRVSSPPVGPVLPAN